MLYFEDLPFSQAVAVVEVMFDQTDQTRTLLADWVEMVVDQVEQCLIYFPVEIQSVGWAVALHYLLTYLKIQKTVHLAVALVQRQQALEESGFASAEVVCYLVGVAAGLDD